MTPNMIKMMMILPRVPRVRGGWESSREDGEGLAQLPTASDRRRDHFDYEDMVILIGMTIMTRTIMMKNKGKRRSEYGGGLYLMMIIGVTK